MKRQDTRFRTIAVLAAAALTAAVAMVALTGCGGGASSGAAPGTAPGAATTPAATGVSGLAALAKAIPAVRTLASDSQFLLVQTSKVATSSPPPSWSFIFASKKNAKLYMVNVDQGEAAAPVELGKSTIAAADYAKIPEPAAWQADTNKVYAAAVAAYKQRYGAAPSPEYAMGMASFVPSGSKTTVKPFVFQVSFAPADKSGTVRVVEVNATTGEVVPEAKK